MQLTPNLNKILYYAHDEAERLACKHIDAIHLLLAIIRLGEGSAYDLLLQARFIPQDAKEQLDREYRQEPSNTVEPITRSTQTERILRIAERISHADY